MTRARIATAATALLTAAAALGCRDDIVLTVPLAGKAEQFVERSFDGKTGATYQLWADYDFEPKRNAKEPKFCYDVEIEVVQNDKVVATTRCYSFPDNVCIGKTGNSRADCETNCAFELAKSGKTSLRSRLTKGEPCDNLYVGLTDPDKQIAKYDLLLEEDD